MKNRILGGEVQAIRELGILSGVGIKPQEIIDAFETDSLNDLKEKAEFLKAIKELYKELCYYYYEQQKKKEKKEKKQKKDNYCFYS